MKPVPDDPRFLYTLESIWREIKNIDWKDFRIYPIIGLVALMVFIFIFYLQD